MTPGCDTVPGGLASARCTNKLIVTRRSGFFDGDGLLIIIRIVGYPDIYQPDWIETFFTEYLIDRMVGSIVSRLYHNQEKMFMAMGESTICTQYYK